MHIYIYVIKNNKSQSPTYKHILTTIKDIQVIMYQKTYH